MIILNELLTYAPALSAIVAALAFAVAVATLFKGVIEYHNQNSLKRFEEFIKMQAIFKSPEIYEMSILIENDDQKPQGIELKERYRYLGYYEQVAIMLNSGILRHEIAHYMFGYFAIRCLESKNFWYGINKNSGYWALFIWFATEMKKIEDEFPSNLSVRRLRI